MACDLEEVPMIVFFGPNVSHFASGDFTVPIPGMDVVKAYKKYSIKYYLIPLNVFSAN